MKASIARVVVTVSAVAFLALVAALFQQAYTQCDSRMRSSVGRPDIALGACWMYVTAVDLATFPFLKGEGL
ncbi:MAG: hypothetical protein CTR55_13795 [Pseudomonas sp.]|nr:MAG: hypothetical protein CTR55_13795 [Pseudomonas sp.]